MKALKSKTFAGVLAMFAGWCITKATGQVVGEDELTGIVNTLFDVAGDVMTIGGAIVAVWGKVHSTKREESLKSSVDSLLDRQSNAGRVK